MRILWASVAPFLNSGYGVQTAMTTPRLQAAGHDVAIAACQGQQNAVLQWPGPRGPIPIFPPGQWQKKHFMDKVARHADEYEADVIFSHYDAWTLNQARMGDDAWHHPWVPWFPIDTDDVAKTVLNAVRGLRGAAYRITQTRHGQAAMHSHGEQCAYIPAAYDQNIYYPRGRREARDEMGFDQDRFTAAVVAANSGTKDAPSRKCFPQIFEAWGWYVRDHDPDALLYVHAMPADHLNLDQLAEEQRITNNVLFVDPYLHFCGMLGADAMSLIYSSADVLVNPAMGEGFGVPIIEAQACGTPVITGEWTSMGEVNKTGHKIPKTRAARYPMAGYGGDMYIPQSEAILDALLEAREWTHQPEDVSARVAEYEVVRVWDEHWTPILREVADLLGLDQDKRETTRMIREMIA